MSDARDWLAYGAARMAWPGLLGLALLTAAALAWLAWLMPMREETARLEARAEHLAGQPRAAPPPPTPELALAAILPSANEAPAAVARLFSAAEHAGLLLSQGSYRVAAERAGARRLHINLPLQGAYPAIRAFLGEALDREVSLALEGIRFSRERMESDQITAQIRFTLYLREETR